MPFIRYYLKHPTAVLMRLSERRRFGFRLPLSDKQYLTWRFKEISRKDINWENPLTFNEKLQWLKLYDRNPKYTMMVDKYEVKKYIAKYIGEEYVIPTLGIWEEFDDIDFNKLPDQFVLKCTHDSGSTVICKNKDDFNKKNTKKALEKCLKQNIYYRGREWPYKNVKPRIIAERYLSDEETGDLRDYKIFNFNGEPKLIQVDLNRFTEHKRNIYDLDWNLVNVEIQFPSDPYIAVKKPEKLDKMLELAKLLSNGLRHVRTDFYYVNGKIYFGELTFYHGSGYEKFTPSKWNNILGSWLSLSEKDINN